MKKIRAICKYNLLPLVITFFVGCISLTPYFFSKISPYVSLGLLSVVEEHNPSSFSKLQEKPLYKSNMLTEKFTASEDNLGLILIRFTNFGKINKDVISFRIKEEGMKDWYRESTYTTDQFQPDQYFTFGFPIIQSARGKTYIIELTSLQGKQKNAIAISKDNPKVGLVYKFSKSDFADPSFSVWFIYKKILFSVKRLDYVLIVGVYVLLLTSFSVLRKRKVLKRIILQFPKLSLKLWNKDRSKFLSQKFANKYLQKIIRFIGSLNNQQLAIIGAGFIFFLALVNRLLFYWDPDNFAQTMIYQIGGHGDYDQLFGHSVRLLYTSDIKTYYWSLLDDYVFLTRIFAIFFYLFGFIKGLDYLTYFFISISSFVCLLPYILLSRLKSFSVGGFIASLFLAFHPLSIWLASSRAVDTLTSFFFALFIFMYVFALEKRQYLFLVLLGLVGFIDALNRGLMLLNNLPALFLFSMVFIFLQDKGKKITKKTLMYSVIPLLTFLFCYSAWNIYYWMMFKVQWVFSPLALVTNWNPVNDPQKILGSSPVDKVVLYGLRFFMSLTMLAKVVHIHIISLTALTSIAAVMLSSKGKKLYLMSLSVLLFIITGLYIIQGYIPNSYINQTVFRYYMSLERYDYVFFFVLLSFIIVQIFLLGKVYTKYFAVIITYIFILGYGLYISFSERHYIQVLLVFFILLGLTIDKLIQYYLPKQRMFLINVLLLSMFFFYCLFFVNTFSVKIINATKDYISHIEDKKYLHAVGKTIPADGIILIGASKENVVHIYENTDKAVIFNAGYPDPIFIPKNKKIFHIPVQGQRSDNMQYNFSDVTSSDILLNKVVSDPAQFQKYKFYILDYDSKWWKNGLTVSTSQHPTLYGKVTMKEAYIIGNRKVYQLVLSK